MDFDPTPFIGGSIAVAILLGVIYLVVTAGMIALGIWITYSIIWRAVRRGLREYHGLGPATRGSAPPPYGS